MLPQPDPKSEIPAEDKPEAHAFKLVDNQGISRNELGMLQKKIRLPILRTPESAPKLPGYMWTAILCDLIDPKIATNTFHSGGHMNGDRRIALTSAYFGEYLRKMDMDGIVDYVNLVHELNGVTDRDEKGQPLTKEHYKESFMYVLSSLIECMRDYYEHELKIPKNSDEGRKIGENLCDLWYGVAQRVGLRQRPETLADHEAFVKAHEARIFADMKDADPRLRQNIQLMTRNFMPKIAQLSHCSQDEAAKLVMKIRPKVGELLAIERQQWPTEKPPEQPAAVATEGPKTDDVTLKALWDAGEKTHDKGIRSIYHMANLQPNIVLSKPEKLHLKPGEALLEQGKPADFLYVVLGTSAPLEVVKTSKGEEVPLATLKPEEPAILGEMRMIRGVSSSTVRAGQQETTVDVVRIPTEQFRLMVKQEGGQLIERSLAPLVQRRSHENEAKSGSAR